MSFFTPSFIRQQRLSCGIVIVNPARELLLCHVTGQHHWDLPKGGIEPGETPVQAALRETREETGLRLNAQDLVELGRINYRPKKQLHLFATLMQRIDVSVLHCDSHFAERSSGRRLPEMDAYGWFAFERIASLCTPRMTAVLSGRIHLDGLVERWTAPLAA